jgi:hypothetical protein
MTSAPGDLSGARSVPNAKLKNHPLAYGSLAFVAALDRWASTR